MAVSLLLDLETYLESEYAKRAAERIIAALAAGGKEVAKHNAQLRKLKEGDPDAVASASANPSDYSDAVLLHRGSVAGAAAADKVLGLLDEARKFLTERVEQTRQKIEPSGDGLKWADQLAAQAEAQIAKDGDAEPVLDRFVSAYRGSWPDPDRAAGFELAAARVFPKHRATMATFAFKRAFVERRRAANATAFNAWLSAVHDAALFDASGAVRAQAMKQAGRLRSRQDIVADAAETTMTSPDRAALELVGDGAPLPQHVIQAFDPFGF